MVNPPYNAHEVETGKIVSKGPEVEALLDNIRSVFNVGNILRSADGVGIRHVHLCGITPTPSNPKLAKTSLGAEHTVAWSYHRDGLAAAISLKEKGLRLWALEGGPRSESLFEALWVTFVALPSYLWWEASSLALTLAYLRSANVFFTCRCRGLKQRSTWRWHSG